MVEKNVNQVKIKKDDQVVTMRINSKSDKEKAAVKDFQDFLSELLSENGIDAEKAADDADRILVRTALQKA